MAGYTVDEIASIQDRWRLRFPPDLVEFLQQHRTVRVDGSSFDWLKTNPETIQGLLDWPLEGFWFDVKHNDVWWPEWGPKPTSLDEQYEVLRDNLISAPTLIPLSGHRYLPEEPSERGNPVFSVYQTDVVCYGADLWDWLERENGGWSARPWLPIKEIPFWSDAVRRNSPS